MANPFLSCKYVNAIRSVALTTPWAATAQEVDCLGYHYAACIFSYGIMGSSAHTVFGVKGGNATSTPLGITSAYKVYDGSAANIAGVTNTAAATPLLSFIDADNGGSGITPNNNDNAIYGVFIDLRSVTLTGLTTKGMRYLTVTTTAGADCNTSCIVILSRNDQGVSTAFDMNLEAALVCPAG